MLEAAQRGDPQAATQLLPRVYTELRKLAAAKMVRELPGQTLQPTALVHEAWLRVSGPGHTNYQNRAHFFAAVTEAMRRILIDSARRKQALQEQPAGARASGPLSASYQQSGLDWPLSTSSPDCFCIRAGLGGCGEGQFAGLQTVVPLLIVEH